MIKELEYTLNRNDIKHFKLFYAFRNKISWTIFIAFLIIFACIFLINANAFFGLMFVLMCSFIIIYVFLRLPPLKMRTTKASIKIDSDKKSFILNGLKVTEYIWANIYKIYNTKHNLLIFLAEDVSIIIPKRIFETEQEMNETWELIQECYNKYKEG